jgi:hypothetical protein
MKIKKHFLRSAYKKAQRAAKKRQEAPALVPLWGYVACIAYQGLVLDVACRD